MENNKRVSIDNYFKNLLEKKRFSGCVLVAKNDDIIINKSYGMANYELDVPNTSKTKFCIASITKSVTGMAIMILVDQGKVKLEDKLSQYIPDYPNGDRITIYHLLTHTAGIFELWKHPEHSQFKNNYHTINEIIEKFKDKPLDFEPGLKFEYSNSGYILLAYIIEEVSGKSYENFVKENIFDKLHMSDTGCFNNEQILKNKANGYSLSEGKIINGNLPNLSIVQGAGDMYSTIEDIFTWSKALLKGELLSKECMKRWLIDHAHAEEDFYSGYGFILFKPNNMTEYIYQDGGLPGYKSIYKIYPEKDLIIIILSNFDFIKAVDMSEEIEKLII